MLGRRSVEPWISASLWADSEYCMFRMLEKRSSWISSCRPWFLADLKLCVCMQCVSATYVTFNVLQTFKTYETFPPSWWRLGGMTHITLRTGTSGSRGFSRSTADLFFIKARLVSQGSYPAMDVEHWVFLTIVKPEATAQQKQVLYICTQSIPNNFLVHIGDNSYEMVGG